MQRDVWKAVRRNEILPGGDDVADFKRWGEGKGFWCAMGVRFFCCGSLGFFLGEEDLEVNGQGFGGGFSLKSS